MQRLLIIGFGDIAKRSLQYLRGRYRIYALTRHANQSEHIRKMGVIPVHGDLDNPESLNRIAGLAHSVLHFAPPPSLGRQDQRTKHLISALGKGKILPQRLVHISTSGVYGDCKGEAVTETRKCAPSTERACRRADAEQRLRRWGRARKVKLTILRVPGIYAAERLPIERIRRGTPAIAPSEDSYTNHIHADDLARIAVIALSRGKGGRIYNVSDDSNLRMGDYFDLVADHFGLPRPPRITRDQAIGQIPPTLLSFMAESRRLINHRMKHELRVRLAYPTVADALDNFLPQSG
jgi:nucleoside-diphosphate-sugar epimerase